MCVQWATVLSSRGAGRHVAHQVVPLVAALFKETRAPEVAPMS